MLFYAVVSLIVLVVLILAGLIGIVVAASLLPDNWSGLEDPTEDGGRYL
jgi:hypothetical protein